MKKQIVAALLLVGLVVFGCTKDDSTTPAVNDITGTWRYIGNAGGFAGVKFTPAPDSIENYLQVDSILPRLLFSYNGQQQCSNYVFEKNDTGNAGLLTLSSDSLTFTNQYDVSLSHDTLAIYPHHFADAFIAYYVPVSKHFNWCADTTAH